MGKIEKIFRKMTIRRSVVWVYLITVCCICLLSGITIFSANQAQQKILSNRDFTILSPELEKDNNTDSLRLELNSGNLRYHPLTGRERAAYYGCYAAMIGLPAAYMITGILIAARIFYRIKLQRPIAELQKGISYIQNNDLDFSIACTSGDELGRLCDSMERMRLELRQRTKKMWELLEQQKLLNDSVSHDLRTPITVLNGYLDYLDRNIPLGRLTEDDLTDTVHYMQEAASRLERYVDCVRDVELLENIEVQYHAESSSDLIAEIQRTIGQMTTEKEIHITTGLPPVTLRTDRQLLLRVVENLIQNALRYAARRIEIDFTDDSDHVFITVRDDGRGFSASDLAHWGTRFYSSEKGRGHFGIGLFVNRLLCEKLGGSLTAGNNETGGAWTLIKIPK